MAGNPLLEGKKPTKGNLFRAHEYAAQARAQGNTKAAEAWDKAAREGWDEKHYDPERNAKHREQIRKGVSPK